METIGRLASLPYWRKMLDKPDGVPVAAFVSLTDSDTGERITQCVGSTSAVIRSQSR